MGYSTQFWGPEWIETARDAVTRISQNHKKLMISGISGRFRGL